MQPHRHTVQSRCLGFSSHSFLQLGIPSGHNFGNPSSPALSCLVLPCSQQVSPKAVSKHRALSVSNPKCRLHSTVRLGLQRFSLSCGNLNAACQDGLSLEGKALEKNVPEVVGIRGQASIPIKNQPKRLFCFLSLSFLGLPHLCAHWPAVCFLCIFFFFLKRRNCLGMYIKYII